MKAKIVLANTNYDLRGTGLKYLGEGHLDGMCIERFRTNEMTVCRSCEPENGKDRLVISFSPFDGGIPDTSTMIELAESLGLNTRMKYEIMTKPSFLCEKELVTYIIQTIPLVSRRYS